MRERLQAQQRRSRGAAVAVSATDLEGLLRDVLDLARLRHDLTAEIRWWTTYGTGEVYTDEIAAERLLTLLGDA